MYTLLLTLFAVSFILLCASDSIIKGLKKAVRKWSEQSNN